MLGNERAYHEHIVPELLGLETTAAHHQLMKHMLQNTICWKDSESDPSLTALTNGIHVDLPVVQIMMQLGSKVGINYGNGEHTWFFRSHVEVGYFLVSKLL